jgi:hypothetical protein
VVLLTESKKLFLNVESSSCWYIKKNVDNIDKEFVQYIIPKDIKDFGLIPNYWSFAGIDTYGSFR